MYRPHFLILSFTHFYIKTTSIKNRGKHPSDDSLFAEKWQSIFKEATHDLSFLFSRGYGEKSATQLVGNRYQLNVRQQKALSRMSVAKASISKRQAKVCRPSFLKEKTVAIDGFNLLIWLESALSGAYILQCQDGTYRDVGGIHGSYKRVHQTMPALLLAGKTLNQLGVSSVHWYFDTPVSNSGRLKVQLYEIAQQEGFPWEVSLVYNPDKVLAASQDIVISSDGWILEETKCWFNFCEYLLEKNIILPTPPVIKSYPISHPL